MPAPNFPEQGRPGCHLGQERDAEIGIDHLDQRQDTAGCKRLYLLRVLELLFSLPGAFTPTCSSSHVPRYNQLQPAFEAAGVDEIICVSVNDAFVMDEWQRAQNADRVSFLPDGNGDFTDGMGLLVGKEDLGFGKRSWRYSMLVRDGVIEPEQPGCPFCARAKGMLP